MLLDYKLFVPLFEQIRNVQRTLNDYCLAPDKVPVSLDDLKYAIEQEYGTRITHKLIPIRNELLRGMIEMYDDHSVIYVDSGLSHAWIRYVVVKEMSHHLVNDVEYWTIDPSAIIEHIVQDGVGDAQEAAPLDVATEYLTKLAAVELLFPFSLREAARARIAQDEQTLYTTAEWLEMPEHLVEFALSDRYTELAQGIWKQLDVN